MTRSIPPEVIRKYASPEASKQGRETRPRAMAKSGAKLARQGQLLMFDRFLARLPLVLGDAAILKGGLELRLASPRTKKDIALRLTGSGRPAGAIAGGRRRNLAVWLTFESYSGSAFEDDSRSSTRRCEPSRTSRSATTAAMRPVLDVTPDCIREPAGCACLVLDLDVLGGGRAARGRRG